MKKIMILSSNFTGHGHASIAQALTEQFDKYDDIRYTVVDGFELIGKMGVKMSKIYGPITRNAKEFWKMSYALVDQHPQALLDPMTVAIHDRFIAKLCTFMPDLILTVHPFFNGTILNILEFYELDIPVYALQADLINITAAWCDPRAKLTLCPTREAYECSIKQGMPPKKLRICGFPTRAQFTEAARTRDTEEYDGSRPLKCLIMSGGEGSGNLLRYAEELLKNVFCTVEVICGRNRKMYEKIKKETASYGSRIKVHGFLTDVHEYMLSSDLIILRGSPNTMMEAVVLGLPMVITGSLPGQEADNPAMMIAHNLGVICSNPDIIASIVGTLMRDGGKRLREIRNAEREYRNLDNAINIAQIIHDEAETLQHVPPKKRMMLMTNHSREAFRRYFSKIYPG
ncbi:MAG: glycosyltransferase [Clostridia bacterium]|nr:glycosyltransferase [Clostridia bacterium]